MHRILIESVVRVMSLFLNRFFFQSHPLTVMTDQTDSVYLFNRLSGGICSGIEGHFLRALQMQRKTQQTMFAWVCELQTLKPGHGCKIN